MTVEGMSFVLRAPGRLPGNYARFGGNPAIPPLPIVQASENDSRMAPQIEKAIGERERRALRIVVVLLTLAGITFVGGIFLYYLGSDIANAQPWMMDVFRKHAAAIFGLPTGALASLGIVLLLEVKSGRIEFEVLGFKFRGASGEIILWVICFMAIITAIKLLSVVPI
jgi:hypothetical protein